MPKPKPIAVIPSDLRERDDLTLASINRIVTLRTRRDDLRAELKVLDEKREQTEADILATLTELAGLLGKDEPEPVAAADID